MDVNLIKQSDGSLDFSVYRKPSYTGKLLDYGSSSHSSQKRCVVKSLVNRAFKICSSHLLEDELEVVKLQLIENGYPKNLVKSEITKARVP